ncbi:hypothetical protein BKA69DRAFT_1049618 [Paraphysoderma sedebokerense]|nr:hypothetical protein BKA69DRAFT_1049618 [Paraphysoderma sedebokerense]
MADTIQITATGGAITYELEVPVTETLENIRQNISTHFDVLGYHGEVAVSFEYPAVADNVEENAGNRWNINRNLLLAAGGMIVGAAATPILLPAALGAVGFTSAGVAAGSAAAGIQSAVYGGYVASGSAFAVCQSIGAAGVGATSVAAGGVAGGAVGGAVAGLLGLRRFQVSVQHGENTVDISVSMSDTLEYIISEIRRREIHVAARVSMNFNI